MPRNPDTSFPARLEEPSPRLRPAHSDQPITEIAGGADLLSDVHAYLTSFIAYPSKEAQVAHTLWIAHCHLMDAWESTPRIAFLSPEPSSGKTRALEISETLVPRPVEAINVTPAYLFRKVGAPDGMPTILFDEIDTVFGPKAKENEEIRGLLNAGHRRGAVAGRCVVRGKIIETEEIPAYCALALAGIGDLPDTVLTRCVVIRMRRRAPSEKINPYRRRLHAAEGHRLRERLVDWCGDILEDVTDAWPAMPQGIEDRDADVWEPLLAVADAAGGDWPGLARVAAVALVALSREGNPSLGIHLLSDLKEIFEDRNAMSTATILAALNAKEEAPWGDLRGKPLDSRRLAYFLRKYEVRSKDVRIGESVVKGYTRADLWDQWSRYLCVPPPGSATSATSATGGDAAGDHQHGGAGDDADGAVAASDEVWEH